MKISKHTEYVNAQTEDLKELIDEYADKIRKMSSGAMLGMIWAGTFTGDGGAVVVYITGDGYTRYYDPSAAEWKYGYQYTLHAAAGFNGGGGWERSADTGILDAVKPESTVTATFTPSWYDYSPDVPCYAELSPEGRLTVSIGSGPSGQANPSARWYRETGYGG